MTKDEELTYKHFVIQFAETLLKRFFLHPGIDNQSLAEGSLYAILFGETIGISSTQIGNILSGTGGTRNELVKLILEDMKTQFQTNSVLRMNDSLRTRLAKYLISTYQGKIDDSRVRTLIGDIFLVSLIEAVYSEDSRTEGIFSNNLLSQLKEKKSHPFLNRLIELLDENSSGIQILSETEENADYVKMAAGLAQYLRYQKILDKIVDKNHDLQGMSYIALVREHLMFLKHLSTDVYSFLDEDVPTFNPSESVFVKYFYIASLLVKTDYSDSIILNSPYAAKFIQTEIRDDAPIHALINSKANLKLENIMGLNDDSSSTLNRIFDPLRFLRTYLGIFGTWILWDLIVLVPLVLGLYHLINYAKYSIIIPDTNISIPGTIIPSITLFYLATSLLLLLYKSWHISTKTKS